MQFTVSVVLTLCVSLACADVPMGLPTKTSKQSAKLPPCKLCSTLTESFNRGMERTARGKHDGGDAAWEEARLGSYKRSEIRLVEIQEALCKDVSRGEDQCHSLAENNEALIEEWWSKHQEENDDLHTWLCIDQLAVCCPPNTFGAKCEPCADCRGNGKCKGDGTRKGNGKCACDSGYQGETCNECDLQHYESFRDESKLLCSVCHVACGGDGGCSGPGPKGCRVCKAGWTMQPELGGCVDVDECATTKEVCTSNQFCVNNEGSFSCLECDKSCSGCTGDGPDECLSCANNFELRDGLCKDLTNEKRKNYVTITRYMTYLGMCIATCIIFQSSTTAAAAVGLVVAMYISLSEYWLNTYQSPSENTMGGDGAGPIPIPLEELLNKIDTKDSDTDKDEL